MSTNDGFEDVPYTQPTLNIAQEDLQKADEKLGAISEESDSFEDAPYSAPVAAKTSPNPDSSTIGDAGRALFQGGTFEYGDEALAGLQAGSDVLLGDKKTSDLSDLYSKYKDLQKQKIEESQKNSPYVYGAMNLAGNVLSGMALPSAKLFQGATKLAGLGNAVANVGLQNAALSVGESDSSAFTPEGQQDLAKEAVTSLALAPVITGAGKLAGKAAGAIGDSAAGYVAESPKVQALLRSFDMGREGTKLYTETGRQAVADVEKRLGDDVAGRIASGRTELGKGLQKAVSSNPTEMRADMYSGAINRVYEDFGAEFPAVKRFFTQNPSGARLIMKMRAGDNLTAQEVEGIQNGLKTLASDLGAENTSGSREAKRAIDDLTSAFTQGFETDEVKAAKKAFAEFSNVPEQILAQDTDQNLISKMYGQTIDSQAKVSDSMQDMVSKLKKTNTQSDPARVGIQNLYSMLEQKPELVKQLGYNSLDELKKKIDGTALDSLVKQQAFGEKAAKGIELSTDAMGMFEKAMDLANPTLTANRLGASPTVKGVADVTRSMYSAPDNVLKSFAEGLQGTTFGKSLGESLMKSLENGDTAGKNAAMFALMQRKDVREMAQKYIPGLTSGDASSTEPGSQ